MTFEQYWHKREKEIEHIYTKLNLKWLKKEAKFSWDEALTNTVSINSDAVLTPDTILFPNMPSELDCSGIRLSARVLFEMIVTLKHARTFIMTSQKMHSTGVELYDELIIFLENLGKEEEETP